jgi:hypothetical protein
MRIFVLLTLVVACSVTAASQQSSQAQEMAASFSKHKSLSIEKNGAKKEKYKDVRSVPDVKQNVGDYAGVYEVSDLGFEINIQVESDGRIQVSGHETNQRSFRLENARIDRN